jgi:hypothetical protein
MTAFAAACSRRADVRQEPIDLVAQCFCLAAQRVCRLQHLRGGGGDRDRRLIDAGDVARHVMRPGRRLLHVARHFLSGGALLIDGGGDGGGDLADLADGVADVAPNCAKKMSYVSRARLYDIDFIGGGEGNRTLVVSLGSCFGAFDIIDLFRKIVVCQCLGRSWRFPGVRRNSQRVCQIVPSVRAVLRAVRGRCARAFTQQPAAPAA